MRTVLLLPAMDNWYLIIVIIIMIIAIVVANFYILVYFTHPEDKNTAIFPKIVTVSGYFMKSRFQQTYCVPLKVAGLSLAMINIMFLPIDVANRNTGGDIPMDILYIVVYMLAGFFLVFLIPFAMFYYEADDPLNPKYAFKSYISSLTAS